MGKKVILIADDDAMSREIIHKFLGTVYEVIEAADGNEALRVLHSGKVDLVILDIVMPGHTGFEVLQTVKCDEKYSDLRVLVATAIQEKTERKALELGADDIVFKPYDPVVVKKRVENLLSMQDQKRELEAALLKAENANMAKTNFLSRVSHDMRTPLNGILGLVSLMKEHSNDNQTIHDLAQLEMSGHYLLNLINDTLDVNKIEEGCLELHPDVCDGRATVNAIIDLITPNIEKKKLHFHVHADDLPYTKLYVDIGRLEQIIMNILGNAVKFTPENGTIDVVVTNLYNDGVTIRDRIVIRDTGKGMSKEFLPKLFEPFTQENPGNTGNTNGTGLGMTITKQIVELMGGTISVESELGKGTTFTLEIPFRVATAEQIKSWGNSAKLGEDTHDFSDKKILLCEDHPINAEITVRLLQKKGIYVDVAENGRIGVEKFKESSVGFYDMILMDIRMPEMDGLEATRNIRKLDRRDAAEIPIIAMTANALDDDIAEVKQAGMDGHLSKPVDISKLYKCLAGAMHLRYQHLKKEILIVDDIEINREAIKAVLCPEFDVYEAVDGKEAMDFLEKHSGVNLVITDIQMPNMDGLELIRQIRLHPKYKRMPIIANTQFGDSEQEEKILALGANDFVYKPTTPKIVEIRVRNIINKY